MAEPQQQVIPEDESFLTDEDMFEKAFEEKHGIEGEPEPEPQPDEGAAAPESGESSDAGELLPEESSEREAEPAAPTSAAEPSAEAAPPLPAWLEKLDEAGKAEALQILSEQDSLRGEYNALHGRLAPVQQENARLRERLANTAQPAQRTDSPPAPAGTPPPSVNFNLSDVSEFKEFQEAFPDEAKALEAVFARQGQSISYLQQQLGGVSQGLQDMQQSSFNQQREAEISRLSGAHPDWATVRPSQDFNDWLQQQPPAIGQLANSPKADDCIWLLDRYKADAYMTHQFSQEQAEPAPQAPQGNGVATRTRARRQQIRSVPSVVPQTDTGVGAPRGGGVPMSDEDIWDQEARRRLRQQRDNNR